MIKNYLLLVLIMIFSYPVCAQTTLNLNPVKDNAIFSESVNNSSGAGKLFAGQTCSDNARRALLKFDLSTVPSGATVNSVTLTLTSDNVSNGALPGQTFTIYGLSKNFGEGSSIGSGGGGQGAAAVAPDATWNANMFGSSLWTSPGGDLSPLPVTSLGLPASTGAHVFPNSAIFVSLINGWINNPVNNFGMIIIGPASPTCSARRFGSKEQGVAPILSINYTPCPTSSFTDIQTACDSYMWIDGNTYTASNSTAMDTLVNAAGCDSMVTLNLTINNSSTSTDVQSACGPFVWIDSNTYNASNNAATHTVNNSVGCDSVITLNLTIGAPSATSDTQSACDSFTWIDGNTYTTSNNTATQTINNAAGCDSVVTLDLTLNNSSSSTDVQSACVSYTWIDGNTYIASNNTATHTINNAVGCDSVITLDLSIETVDIATSLSGAIISASLLGTSFQWINCDNGDAIINGETNQTFTATSNGTYAVIVDQGNCIDTSACVAISSVGVIENDFGNKLVIYPNPSKGNFSIDLGTSYKEVQVTITDLSGSVIQSLDFNELQYAPILLDGANGVYILSILSGNKQAIIKLVKE